MNPVDRTHLVLQPFRATGTNPDRRGKNQGRQPFDLEVSNVGVEPEARIEVTPEGPLSSGGDEGIGEHVNIVV
jgi:hypothetical protein